MSSKAATYLEQLDRARCDGNWSAVPELVRKVRKHAPDRECIALTAETECAISNATSAAAAATAANSGRSSSNSRPSTSRPSTSTNANANANSNNNANASAASAAKSLDAPNKIPKLLELIEKETNHTEDKFQAEVCVGWLHWVVAEYKLALVRLPKSMDHPESQLDAAAVRTEWTTVCALKAAYLRANCLTRGHKRKEAIAAFQSGLPALSQVWFGRSIPKQLAYWSELFLTEYCMLTSQALEEDEASLEDHNSIACFRSWAKYWDALPAPGTGGYGFRGSVPRRRIWNEYYVALSRILEEDLPYPTGYLNKIPTDTSARTQLRTELKTAESTYQHLLLSETAFPRADEGRLEVEEFVNLVVKNWSLLCGRGWREQDLGQGGRHALSRGVLDILYSAATKTFHSTAILRSLFILHLSVGEFELAFKAFDSYLDIVKKGKARFEKTGEVEQGLDSDGTILETMARAITALCQYGHRPMAEKARHLGAELEHWLAKLPQAQPKAVENGTSTPSSTKEKRMSARREAKIAVVAPRILALSWQAIGLSQAHWSRVTHEASSRTEIQARAIRCLRRSLAAEFGRSKDIKSYFALGVLLAERRELGAAIEVVKTALVSSRGNEEQYSLHLGQYWQERCLVPMWHLLALLLSARQDYVMAARACEGALEQFKDPSVLFGKEDAGFRSEHLNEAGDKSAEPNQASRGLVDEMDDAEKEAILEVKMTQLALVELMEGPDVAVNASYELLALFSRLFGNIPSHQSSLIPPKPAAGHPPKTSGTLRNIRGSIFGGIRDRSRPPTRQQSTATGSEKSSTAPARPETSKTVGSTAPTIQVTGDGERARSRRSSFVNLIGGESRPRNSLKKRDRSVSRRRTSSQPPISSQAPEEEQGNKVGAEPETVVDGESFFTPAPTAAAAEQGQTDFFSFANKRQSSSMSSSFSQGRTLPNLKSYLSTSSSKSSDLRDLSAETIHASTALLPVIQFSKDTERHRKTTILIGVWLMIAGFYRRADMLDDCRGAVAEAQKLVQALEAEANRDPSTLGEVKSVGWAEKKSIENLWGDVYCEHALRSLGKDAPYSARSDFESALTHAPDHPAATVGLSNILLDIYSEDLLPNPTIPPLDSQSSQPSTSAPSTSRSKSNQTLNNLPSCPIGLATSGKSKPSSTTSATNPADASATAQESTSANNNTSSNSNNNNNSNNINDADHLPEPYKTTSLPLADRLAARDRAYALLSGLTRLGSGWNYSDAWFALARAYEESGQPDKAKEVLWWCVELEEARGVREWLCLGADGGYII